MTFGLFNLLKDRKIINLFIRIYINVYTFIAKNILNKMIHNLLIALIFYMIIRAVFQVLFWCLVHWYILPFNDTFFIKMIFYKSI